LDKLSQFLLWAPVVLFSMVAHEYAHGYAALKQGDSTAHQLGRLTWNPIKHIDPFMTILMPLMTFYGSGGRFMFGGAKPVPVNPRNYRNYKRGDIIVSMAGIATNLVLSVLCALLIILMGLVARAIAPLGESVGIVQQMMEFGVFFNLMLAVFNLLPIPPLDGSHVMKYLLPATWALRYQQISRFGILILLILVATPIGQPVFNVWMKPVFGALAFALGKYGPFLLKPSMFSGM
jgi:Zn-dependent protease